uniref:hypothetical protein n=1 Tax=uncultured Zhongshania sp. TaxID=1642288 RepID=UPI0030D6F509
PTGQDSCRQPVILIVAEQDIKALMEYVGWKDIKTALKYIEADDPFLSQYNKSLNLPDNQM